MEMLGLQQWAQANITGRNLPHAWKQVIFVRDYLPRRLYPSYDEVVETIVVSTHTSKSVKLPVYGIAVPNRLNITMRGNFHDWQVSVDASVPVKANFYDLFDPEISPSYIYCEGFSREWVYGPYADNGGRFSVTLANDNDLDVFLFLLGAALGLRKR